MRTTPNSIRRASIIEGLEDRRLLSADITFADGILKVEGDVGVPNQIRIFSQLRIGQLVAMAGSRSRHNTYLSVPLVWAMINYHTSAFSGNVAYLILAIPLGWAAVYLIYNKAGTVKGF